MPPPIGVSDLWKMFEWLHSRKATNKSAIGEWLDAVYADLNDLASVWIKITTKLDKTTIEGNVHNGLEILRRGHNRHSQYVYGGRLQSFYHAASLVLQARGEQFDQSFVDDLGFLLMYRNNAAGVVNNEFKSDQAQINLWLGEMDVAFRSIQDQMRSLQVLIATFKASG
jgi:hypothetical protein